MTENSLWDQEVKKVLNDDSLHMKTNDEYLFGISGRNRLIKERI